MPSDEDAQANYHFAQTPPSDKEQPRIKMSEEHAGKPNQRQQLQQQDECAKLPDQAYGAEQGQDRSRPESPANQVEDEENFVRAGSAGHCTFSPGGNCTLLYFPPCYLV